MRAGENCPQPDSMQGDLRLLVPHLQRSCLLETQSIVACGEINSQEQAVTGQSPVLVKKAGACPVYWRGLKGILGQQHALKDLISRERSNMRGGPEE